MKPETYLLLRTAFRKAFRTSYVGLSCNSVLAAIILDDVAESILTHTFLPTVIANMERRNMPKGSYKRDFVKYVLTGDEIEDMKAQLLDVNEPFDILLALVSDGYRVNFRYVEDRSAYNVILTPISEKNQNDGLMLSTFHSDPIKALFELWYVHFVVKDGKWSDGDGVSPEFW